MPLIFALRASSTRYYFLCAFNSRFSLPLHQQPTPPVLARALTQTSVLKVFSKSVSNRYLRRFLQLNLQIIEIFQIGSHALCTMFVKGTVGSHVAPQVLLNCESSFGLFLLFHEDFAKLTINPLTLNKQNRSYFILSYLNLMANFKISSPPILQYYSCLAHIVVNREVFHRFYFVAMGLIYEVLHTLLIHQVFILFHFLKSVLFFMNLLPSIRKMLLMHQI